ncbi:MAGE-like protein 2 [Dermacentor albipictus]|uniref:MAGE-like protein 2 n=1 Tax=Dermacentor albipictus TaxID=60249 RepID=UPI0038FC9B2B
MPAPKTISEQAAAWPAPTCAPEVQQQPFDAHTQLPPSQMQQPWVMQPQMAQLPQGVPWQPQSQQLQLPPQLAQAPLMPSFGVPDPAVGPVTFAGPLQPGTTVLPPAPTVADAAVEAAHAAGATAPGFLADISQLSDTNSSTSSAGQPAAALQDSLQDMAMCALPPMPAARRSSLQESDVQNAENKSRFVDTATCTTDVKKFEEQPPNEAPPLASEAPQVKPERSEREKKLVTPGAKESAKTAMPETPKPEKLGSSEEFYEEIAEVVEPDKKAGGSQSKRVIRKTTRSRKHDVTEEPWEDGSPKGSAIPTLPRWENIQPSTSRADYSDSAPQLRWAILAAISAGYLQ